MFSLLWNNIINLPNYWFYPTLCLPSKETRRSIYILILDYIIMELIGITLFEMNIFCFFRFSWNKLRDLYPALCKLLSKSKSESVSDWVCILDSEILFWILWPLGRVFACLIHILGLKGWSWIAQSRPIVSHAC